MFEYLKQR